MDPNVSSAGAWHGILVFHQHEKKVVERLSAKGLDCFVPLRSADRQWSDRVKKIRLPIFTNYVFCRFGRAEYPLVIRVPGVVDLLRGNCGLIDIPDSEIDELRRLSEVEAVKGPESYIERGNEVLIDHGRLSGMRVFAVDRSGIVEFVKSFHSFTQSCILNRDVVLDKS